MHTTHYIHMKVLDHVMPREKRCRALDSCFGLVGPHQQSIPQLLSLASRVYKGYIPGAQHLWFEIHSHFATGMCCMCV